MAVIKRSDGADPDFALLVSELDAELWERYPALQAGYDKLNKLPAGARVVLAYEAEGGEPLGCGCIKDSGERGVAELKRMFVRRAARGRGLSKAIALELEAWARESGARRLILETGVRQPEAIGLYGRMGFARIENYGEYAGDANSLCMGKDLD